MEENPEKVMYFAETDSRNKRIKFGIKTKDRSRHMYVIGKTGMGKSTLLENLAVQDIQNGHGFAFIDPHGKTADLLLDYVPQERLKDVLYFAPFDMEHPVSFNVMEDVGADKRHLVANGLMSAFKKIWVDAWSARMEYILNNILLALLEYPNSTLIGVNRMLADEDYRNKVVEYVTDPSVKAFWVDEFAKYGPRYMQEAGAAIQNKIGQFLSNPLVRNIIGQPKSTFDIRDLMDKKKILIINLSKGRVGDANANLIGSMLITKIYLGAMSRADVTETELQKLPNFYLYVDEFQNFANESFADILSEARKYRLNLIVAHQYIEQMKEEVRAAVFGNVGTMVTFRVGAFDAEFLEKEYGPDFMAADLVNLGFAQVYLKLMIDGVTSRPFSATTLPPIAPPATTLRNEIIDNSRKVYANPRNIVENEIKKWHEEAQASADARAKEKEFKKDRHNHITSALTQIIGKDPKAEAPVHKIADLEQTGERERDLRKAISLNYLRTARPKEKKAPTEEHLADLRKALSSITEVPKVEQNKKVDTKPEGFSNKTEERAEAKKIELNHPRQDDVDEEGYTPLKKKVKEVPEDILKRILEIE